MTEIKKIIVIDPSQPFAEAIKNTLDKAGIGEYEFEWFHELILEEINNTNYVLININLVANVLEFIAKIKNQGVEKIIFITDVLGDSRTHTAIASGANVFYRHSPISLIIQKIFGTYIPYKTMPKGNAQGELEEDMHGKIIAVYSPKGGTGKTTLSTNMAIQYAMKGLKVLMVDMSQFGNVGVNFKVVHRGTGLSGVFTTLEQNTISTPEMSITKLLQDNIHQYTNENVSLDILIAAPPIKMEKVSEKEVEHIITGIRRMNYDVIIVDTSSEISKRTLATLEMADDIIIVMKPEISGGWNLIQSKEFLDHLGIGEKCKLVINGYYKYYMFSCRELEAEVQYPLIGIIPEHKDILFFNNQGKLISFKKNNKINSSFRKVCHSILPIFKYKEIK